MAFQPAPNDSLTIGGVAWRVAAHPAAADQAFARSGAQATVYRLLSGDDAAPESRALKVFQPAGRAPALATLADWLAGFANQPGLAVAGRQVLTPNRERALLAEQPDLQYAALMPWIDGPTWSDVVGQRYALPADWSLALARSLTTILEQMEVSGLAHCQLAGPNIVLPGLVGQTGGDAAGQPVALVDLEGIFGPGLASPAAASAGSPSYRHPAAGAAWSPDADRFAGSLLLGEMLGWCDEAVRNAAHGDTYFDLAELGHASERYDLLHQRVYAWWGPAVAGLLDRAWRSAGHGDCPSFAEWQHELPLAAPLAPTYAAPMAAAAISSDETTSPPIVETAALAGLAAAALPDAPVDALPTMTDTVVDTTPPTATAVSSTAMPLDDATAPGLAAAEPVPAGRRRPSAFGIAVLAAAALVLLVSLIGLLFLPRPSSPTPTTIAAVGKVATPNAAATLTPFSAATKAAGLAATPTVAAGAPTSAPATGAATSAPAAGATPSPAAGQKPAGATTGQQMIILFSSHQPDIHDSQIWIMDQDGGRARPLTFTRGHSWAPRLSPDGSRILFSSVAPGEHTTHDPTGGGTSVSPGNHDIYVGDADGTNIENVTAQFNAWDNGWSWSPDGKSIAFSSDRDGNWELYKMSAKGDSIVRLTNHPKLDGWPAWTPDGKNIVFASDRTGNWEIFVMNDDGSNQRQLTERPNTYDTFPAVSPDGKKIAFSSQTPGRNEGEIYAMNIDGTGLVRLTSTVAMNNMPNWCPDGRIAFVSDRAGNDDLWIMNGDGANPVRLTSNRGEDTTPSCGYLRRS